MQFRPGDIGPASRFDHFQIPITGGGNDKPIFKNCIQSWITSRAKWTTAPELHNYFIKVGTTIISSSLLIWLGVDGYGLLKADTDVLGSRLPGDPFRFYAMNLWIHECMQEFMDFYPFVPKGRKVSTTDAQ